MDILLHFQIICFHLPQTDDIAIHTIMMVESAALIAVGIFFYLPADIVPLAGEGAV